jgi:hypothetical protein
MAAGPPASALFPPACLPAMSDPTRVAALKKSHRRQVQFRACECRLYFDCPCPVSPCTLSLQLLGFALSYAQLKPVPCR